MIDNTSINISVNMSIVRDCIKVLGSAAVSFNCVAIEFLFRNRGGGGMSPAV